jgi:hypothetical protein
VPMARSCRSREVMVSRSSRAITVQPYPAVVATTQHGLASRPALTAKPHEPVWQPNRRLHRLPTKRNDVRLKVAWTWRSSARAAGGRASSRWRSACSISSRVTPPTLVRRTDARHARPAGEGVAEGEAMALELWRWSFGKGNRDWRRADRGAPSLRGCLFFRPDWE